ncbi:hypothetical protein BN903_248 [Halorubrum sp. AJ67]|nr:hypothetical protein BN903_248 [Halorubrum sp. AJ67]
MGTGLALRVGLHEEPAEVRDQVVYLVGLSPPPLADTVVERIGGVEVADQHRCREVHREVRPNSVPPEHRRQPGEVFEAFGFEELPPLERVEGGVGAPAVGLDRVDVVEHDAVDPHRREQAGVVLVAVSEVGQPLPVEDRLAAVPALDRPVERRVPLVDHAVCGRRLLADVEVVDRFPGTQQAEEVEGPVDEPPVGRRGDDDTVSAVPRHRAHEVSAVIEAVDVLGGNRVGDHRHVVRRADGEEPVDRRRRVLPEVRLPIEKRRDRPTEFVTDGATLRRLL